jgi:CheY-like chemotaxis protein
LKFDVPRRENALVIVDDSKDLISVYEKHFEAAGLRIVAKFSSGEDVLSYFATSRSDTVEAVVLLDHRMPDVDGLETARQLKERNPNQRIILTVMESPVKLKIDEGSSTLLFSNRFGSQS